MCNAVVSSITNDYGSGKIEENNCSNETSPNIVMTDSNIESITSLYLGGNNIFKITGIEYFASLTELYLFNNQITDLTPLKDLTNLTRLYLNNNQISDLSPLSNLTKLNALVIFDNPFNDITPILKLNMHYTDGMIWDQRSDVATHNKVYELPSLFLLLTGALDVPDDAGPWVRAIMTFIDSLEWDEQNVSINSDKKSATIEDTTRPAIIKVYLDHPTEGRLLVAQLTITYEESPEPEPTPIPDDPAVPNTGKNTQESNTVILTATLYIFSGIILTAIPMTRLYFKNRK